MRLGAPSRATSAAPHGGSGVKVLLIDDDALTAEVARACLETAQGVETVQVAHDGHEALIRAEAFAPDLVILDVNMPGLNGMDLAGLLSALTPRPALAFLTAYPAFAARAFELDAVDYVVKPFTPERLLDTVARARRRLEPRLPAAATRADAADFWVAGRQGRTRVPVSDLVWIEAARDYVVLHTRDRSHIHRARMSELERRLPADFVRAHRSALVRLSTVREVIRDPGGGLTLALSSGARVPVSQRAAPTVLARLAGRA